MEPISWAIYQAGLSTTAAEYSLALSSWDQAAATMVAFFDDYDVYLTPTTAKTAPALAHQFQSPLLQAQIAQVENLSPKERQNLVYDFFYDSLTYSPFTQLANLTGQPAISLPTYVDKKSGLPWGFNSWPIRGKKAGYCNWPRCLKTKAVSNCSPNYKPYPMTLRLNITVARIL